MIKKILLSIVLFVLGGYFIASITLFNKPSDSEVCTQVKTFVNDSLRAGFINAKEVERILKSFDLYPIDKKVVDINTREIEDKLQENPFINKAQCYRSATGKICIEISQRLPILRILSRTGESCYLDAQGHHMASGNALYAANLPVVTGHVTSKYAIKYLLPLGQYIQEDEFWDSMIEQINITENGNVELVPRVGNHIVYLGKPEQFEEKLYRLKIFYEKALSQIGWNKYSRINLEFSNQIICTKK